MQSDPAPKSRGVRFSQRFKELERTIERYEVCMWEDERMGSALLIAREVREPAGSAVRVREGGAVHTNPATETVHEFALS